MQVRIDYADGESVGVGEVVLASLGKLTIAMHRSVRRPSYQASVVAGCGIDGKWVQWSGTIISDSESEFVRLVINDPEVLQRRKHWRLGWQLPTTVVWDDGARLHHHQTVTINVSCGGLALQNQAHTPFPALRQATVSVALTLPDEQTILAVGVVLNVPADGSAVPIRFAQIFADDVQRLSAQMSREQARRRRM